MSRLCDICGNPVKEDQPPMYGAVVCDACAEDADDWFSEEPLPCEECGGSGWDRGQECEWCDGTGVEDY